MDRCVWFIILFVMSHLAHELSGATINDDINKVINDTVVVMPTIQNKINFNEKLQEEPPASVTSRGLLKNLSLSASLSASISAAISAVISVILQVSVLL